MKFLHVVLLKLTVLSIGMVGFSQEIGAMQPNEPTASAAQRALGTCVLTYGALQVMVEAINLRIKEAQQHGISLQLGSIAVGLNADNLDAQHIGEEIVRIRQTILAHVGTHVHVFTTGKGMIDLFAAASQSGGDSVDQINASLIATGFVKQQVIGSVKDLALTAGKTIATNLLSQVVVRTGVSGQTLGYLQSAETVFQANASQALKDKVNAKLVSYVAQEAADAVLLNQVGPQIMIHVVDDVTPMTTIQFDTNWGILQTYDTADKAQSGCGFCTPDVQQACVKIGMNTAIQLASAALISAAK